MFRAIVSVVCTDCLSRRVTFVREVELPFVPFLGGPELGFVAARHDWAGEVIGVVYELATNTYHVELGEWDGPMMTLDEMEAAMGPAWRKLGRAA